MVLVLSVNICAELHPVGTIPLEDTDMPRMFAGTVVVGGAYSQAISIGRQRQIKPEVVIAGLAQKVRPGLVPSGPVPVEHFYLAGVGSTAVVTYRADCDPVAIL